MGWDRFNDQFRETDWERQERWRKTREQRRAEGKCWQCAKPIAVCDCPNVSHPKPDSDLDMRIALVRGAVL